VAFEQYKTQVLLLHSEQSRLDVLSKGFNDRYSVHCATSGTEALNTLGVTPIHVIVSAHDLPGMRTPATVSRPWSARRKSSRSFAAKSVLKRWPNSSIPPPAPRA